MHTRTQTYTSRQDNKQRFTNLHSYTVKKKLKKAIYKSPIRKLKIYIYKQINYFVKFTRLLIKIQKK